MFKSLLAFLLFTSTVSVAQTWNWAVNTGETVYGETVAKKTAADPANGGAYVLGEFNGSVGFGADSVRGAGFEDVYLAKYNTAGQMLWVRSLGGSENERAVALATDGAGNAYIGIEFESPVVLVNGIDYVNAGGDSAMGGLSFKDVLIAKIDPAGNWRWVRRIGGPESDDMGDMVADIGGNVYLSAYIWETDTLGGTTIGNVGDTFIAKLNANGAVQWVTQGGSDQDAGCTAYGLALNPQGTELAATGCFVDDAVFGVLQLHGPLGTGSYDVQAYVARINAANGTWAWAMQAGGEDADMGSAVRFDSAGGIVAAGSFISPAFSIGAFVLNHQDSLPSYWPNGYVARISPTGTPLWAAGGHSTGSVDITDLEPTRDGDFYVAGITGDTAHFGTNVAGDFTTSDYNPFVARIDGETGVWQWAFSPNQIPGCGCGHIATQQIDLSVPNVGDVYVTSRFTDSARFGGFVLHGPTYFSSGQGQGYLLGLGDQMPILTAVTPPAGQPGTGVTISGERLGTATKVTFNGIDAPFTVVSGTTIAVTVPMGATTGLIHITTPDGQANSPIVFQVQPTATPDGLGMITGIGPNPAHEWARVRVSPSTCSMTLELQDALGRTVRRKTLNPGEAQAVLSVKGLRPGLYTVRGGGQNFRLTVE